jgi:hypothetical protein
VREVNNTNGNLYLDAETLKRIHETVANAKLRTYYTTLSDLYRLALISQHGGIYLDATFVFFEGFEWIVNIGRYPSQYVFNRFGHLPKVLLYWGVQDGSPVNWEIDEKYNTKNIWHLAYESNFIAADKGTELVT